MSFFMRFFVLKLKKQKIYFESKALFLKGF